MNILVSGIQPTGQLHLGNYLGAIKNWLELQKKYQCFFFIADLHALTTKISAAELKKQTFEIIVDLLALGLDPKKAVIFRQSDIIGHAELTWIFNCLIPVAELNRMTQFKDKSKMQPDNINAGLLTYPVLQAADILLYKGEVVPVGEDQLQHLELSCKLARKFNHRYGQFFAEIQPILSPTPRLMSLNNPEKKMSKSLGEKSYVAIRDSKDIVSQKIKKAVADKKGVENLLTLYSYFGQNKKYQQMKTDFKAGKLMNANLKDELTKVILGFLEPLQKKIATYQKNPQTVNKIITQGNQQAQKIADQNLTEIKKIVGLR
ncbi:MAG: tryptophan--tRNA ligase [Candidatus Komeilibacteria bacterium CG11_big_fil_rev_8_21_14_0_20_36_20]|uniref:Tryptophan--tRNA ligase n=1 Tax=Candidatus Komeilibacteria bacterium CG11_big_fil_rev_8_21_14_0_20_36_20 TaxID=1974477 RepID=A0A2H0NB72_9BACT|nr:MAG: tryptophan--tRNA ligase [Candidatus Komeilibacteria bacterium CG11_big_fil_rev_8_21_14_0_20_36_20]PIR81858.1 MAG: tryptophan--tRNA ligase [Candidatus Komeilibacteria bacterium CG10_big_fil_rev_8_21_14_0_10_36_65]PJC55066.1 MAG: tryptophan--tRNA ligase [Candidatus Komeilibacteria bacterium CG_4_9_14_0_2_um_filter_36_13]